ncbi:MAG: MFS transporter [Puniceicoccaceae bacterium]
MPSTNPTEDPVNAAPQGGQFSIRKTAEEDKIPIHEKGLFGLGNQSIMLVNHVIENQLQQVLVYGMHMSPAWNTLIIMTFRIWDALIDPFIGWFSDNTRTRWGRRRPFMLMGCILMAALLPFVWRFNENWNLIYIALWITLFGMIISTAASIFNVPYQALKMEMTPDYNERTSLNVYIMVISSLFTILIAPWVWKMTQLPLFTGQEAGEEPNTLIGIRNLSVVFGGLALLLGLIALSVSKERYYKTASHQKKEKLISTIRLTFKSKPFRLLLGIIFVSHIEGLVLGMGGYLSVYYVFGGDKIQAATVMGWAGTIGGFTGLFSAPLIGLVAKRIGKERALLIVTLADVLITLSILVCYNPNWPWLSIVPGILNGLVVGAFWVIVPSMQADVVDEDELRTGERREGSFLAILAWALRLVLTVSAGMAGIIVLLLGFRIELETNQAEGVFRNLKVFMALVPAVFGVAQFFLVMKWPLPAQRMADIRAALEDRRGRINT